MKLAAIGCVALLLLAATASADLIYIKNCTLGPANCATYNITAGCSPMPTDSLMRILQGCKRPEKDQLCLFQQKFNTSDCSGSPYTPWTLANRCNYCEHGSMGGVMGTQYYCNATAFSQQACQDNTCWSCTPTPWQSVGCSQGVNYRVQACPYLYYNQVFDFDCSNPDMYGLPMYWYASPVSFGDVTFSCTPF